MSTIIVFPGQGSQFIGMGKDLYENSTYAKDIFQEVDDALGQNLSKLIFEGEINELTLTSNTQPAIMTASIAAFRVFINAMNFNNDIGKIYAMAAGHSLGEYSALCAIGAISLHDTAKLLRIRGNAMQNAVPDGVGAMVALLGVEDIINVEKLIDESLKDISNLDQASNTNIKYICQIANDNGAGQIVLSGHKEAIDKVIELAPNFNIKRAIKLPVSAPFHSNLMMPAEKIMQEALSSIQMHKPIIQIISNYTAELNNDTEVIKVMLVKQIAGMVRWRETMDVMLKNNIDTIIEFGPGKVLTTLANRSLTENNITTYNISTLKDIDDYNNK